jgi:hypothetical protein
MGIEIHGRKTVEAVSFEKDGVRRTIACDGAIVSGSFVGENALFMSGPLAGLESSASHFTHVTRIGNVQGKLKTAGRCVVEACSIADTIARNLA